MRVGAGGSLQLIARLEGRLLHANWKHAEAVPLQELQESVVRAALGLVSCCGRVALLVVERVVRERS